MAKKLVGVMTKYLESENTLVYPGCKYARDMHYHSLEQDCTHPKTTGRPYCSDLCGTGKCPLGHGEKK